MIFVCNDYPQLRIALTNGDYAVFLGGKLELDPEDEGYAEVKAEAERNPHIQILTVSTTCSLCGAIFTGKAAKASLGSHTKDIHFEVWQAQKELEHQELIAREVKARAGYVCDACAPIQTFGSEGDLAGHIRDLHTTPPELDEEGNTVGRGNNDDDRRPGEVAAPTAARRSTRTS